MNEIVSLTRTCRQQLHLVSKKELRVYLAAGIDKRLTVTVKWHSICSEIAMFRSTMALPIDTLGRITAATYLPVKTNGTLIQSSHFKQ